uniref:F-box domain-containing protein n=1 Tax=Panagrellus redivivus TaxID=6233 RepID=A0A7E5A043_PANRE
MASYLRPHLYPDLLDAFKKIVPADALCNFVLSSSNAYQTVARHITTPVTEKVKEEFVDDEFYAEKFRASILHQTTNGVLFEFTEQHHICQLLHLSGQYCEYMSYTPPPKAPWNASFYEGVTENQCFGSLDGEDGRDFIEAYVSKRDTIKCISVRPCHEDIADLLVGKTIKKMYADNCPVDDINTALELNIECLNFEYDVEPVEQVTFQIDGVDCRPSLKTLKKVKFSICMDLLVVVPTLEKLRNIKKLVFSLVRIDMKYKLVRNLDKVLNLVTQGMKKLWDAMLKFPGSVKIKFAPHIIGVCDVKEVADLFRREYGFKVKEDAYEVKLRMKMTASGKTTKLLKVTILTVFPQFPPAWNPNYAPICISICSTSSRRSPDLCKFALSSSEAYQTVARYITMARTEEVRNRCDDKNFTVNKYRTSILHQTTNGMFVEFTEQYHINQFLYLSGKFCEFMMYACPPKAPWNASFYEGVADNQCLCTIGAEGRSFAEAYVSKRDTIKRLNPGCRVDDISDLLVGKTIKNLSKSYVHVDDNSVTRELNVEYVNLDAYDTPNRLVDNYT